RTSNIFHSRDDLLEYERALLYKREVDDILEGTSGVPTREGLQRVKEVFEEVYPRWKTIIKIERGKSYLKCDNDSTAIYYLQRYTPGTSLIGSSNARVGVYTTSLQ